MSHLASQPDRVNRGFQSDLASRRDLVNQQDRESRGCRSDPAVLVPLAIPPHRVNQPDPVSREFQLHPVNRPGLANLGDLPDQASREGRRGRARCSIPCFRGLPSRTGTAGSARRSEKGRAARFAVMAAWFFKVYLPTFSGSPDQAVGVAVGVAVWVAGGAPRTVSSQLPTTPVDE